MHTCVCVGTKTCHRSHLRYQTSGRVEWPEHPPVPVAIAIDGTRELRADSNDNKTPGVEQEVRESDLSASGS